MQMGNCLLERGHQVRIAYQRSPRLSGQGLKDLGREAKLWLQGITQTSWLRRFQGAKASFVRLADLRFEPGEVVIATGVHTIGMLQSLGGDVIKVRYCHGLLEWEPEERRMVWLWDGPMDTISVSPVLVPALQARCTGRLLGVVPNGIYPEEYFIEPRTRDGVGLIYGQHPVKGPEVAVALVQALHRKFPEHPRYVFGTSRRAAGLTPCHYTRYPSLEKARQLYNRSKVWLVTSRDEGFCLPILEAMACGCAVITSRHTNAAELIQDGVNGFIVPYGDIEAYVERVGRLLEDEALRLKIVQAGLKTVERFSWKIAADQMEAALSKLGRGEADASIARPASKEVAWSAR
jgi:hypothetical protein